MRTAVLGLLLVVVVVAVAAPQGGAAPRTHLVRPGDTLYHIARRYGVTIDVLVRANRLPDPARLLVGQQLVIPETSAPRALRPAGRPDAAAGAPGGSARTRVGMVRRYVVQRGDTLTSIARRHGTTVAALIETNGLRSDRLYPGQSMRLPPAVSVESAPLAVPGSSFSAPAVSPGPPAGATVSAPRPLRVRRGPKSYHTTLAIAAQGTPLAVLAAEGRWALVRVPDGAEGWVASEDLLERPSPPASEVAAGRGTDIVREALRYVGTPYIWGGESSRGVDCSGFVYVVFSGRMPQLARVSASDYFRMGTPVERPDLRPGDLVFFTTYAPGPSHVGIYAGSGRFIQASSGARRVVITPLDDAYYAARYLGARRLLAP
jgi:cell wall-associated NlpC family hydrolase